MSFQDIRHTLANIDWQQFHFLRPKALYLFYGMAFVIVWLLVSNREQRRWKRMIAPGLRRYMFTRSNPWAMLMPLLLFILGFSLLILSLAGPSWKKQEIPGQKIQAVVLIGLDLSRSMLADDIPPNRLERAKLKICDLLEANPKARAGLLAFAGTAHPVLPFTSDYKLIRHHALSLSNREMPVQGSDLSLWLAMADTMLRHIEAPSTLVLMTDVLDAEQATVLSNYMRKSPHRLELLLFATPEGAVIPGYQEVSKQDPVVLHTLAQNKNITVNALTLDKSDVAAISKRVRDKLIFEKQKENTPDKAWQDEGWLLVFPILVIALFWFRRGWVIQWCWLAAIPLFGSCGLKSKHPDWWYTRDYQGQLYMNAHNYTEAAKRYTDDRYKAVAYYKAGNYDAAATLFALDSTAAGHYNLGLALAKLGRYREAMTNLQTAQQLDPSLAARIHPGLRQMQQALQQTDSTALAEQHEKQTPKKSSKKDPLKERRPQSPDEKLSSDTEAKQLPKNGQRASDEVSTDIHKAREAKRPPSDFELPKNSQLDRKILLRKAENDPGEFLHRRFLLQKERYYKHLTPPEKLW